MHGRQTIKQREVLRDRGALPIRTDNPRKSMDRTNGLLNTTSSSMGSNTQGSMQMQLFKISVTDTDELLKKSKEEAAESSRLLSARFNSILRKELYSFDEVLNTLKQDLNAGVQEQLSQQLTVEAPAIQDQEIKGLKEVEGELSKLRKRLNLFEKLFTK